MDQSTIATAAELVTKGTKAYWLRRYAKAVSHFSKASEMMVAKLNDDKHDLLGSVYLYYGKSLLELAREESNPLGEGVPPEVGRLPDPSKGETAADADYSIDEVDSEDTTDDEEAENDEQLNDEEEDEAEGEEEDEGQEEDEEADDDEDYVPEKEEIAENSGVEAVAEAEGKTEDDDKSKEVIEVDKKTNETAEGETVDAQKVQNREGSPVAVAEDDNVEQELVPKEEAKENGAIGATAGSSDDAEKEVTKEASASDAVKEETKEVSTSDAKKEEAMEVSASDAEKEEQKEVITSDAKKEEAMEVCASDAKKEEQKEVCASGAEKVETNENDADETNATKSKVADGGDAEKAKATEGDEAASEPQNGFVNAAGVSINGELVSSSTADRKDESGDEAMAEDEEDEDDTDVDEKAGSSTKEEEEPTDLQLAWEVLELAKFIFTRREAKGLEELADCLITLGEVSLETENFDCAINDIAAGLSIQKELYSTPKNFRKLAETYYKLGMAKTANDQIEEGIVDYGKTLALLNKRYDILLAKGENAGSSDNLERQEIKTLIPEIEEKIADLKTFKGEAARKAPAEGISAGPSSSAEQPSSSSKDKEYKLTDSPVEGKKL